jgi:hypothetical protein
LNRHILNNYKLFGNVENNNRINFEQK